MKLNIRQIQEGFTNLTKKKLGMEQKEIELMAQKRMDICNPCEHKTPRGRCAECGCVLSAKTRSPTSSCPINKW